MTIEEIRQRIREGTYEFSIHAQQERLEDDLDVTEIETAILIGEIIEVYPQDPRGPSCLVAGYSGTRAVHIVLGWARPKSQSDKVLRVITVYIPRPPKWKDSRTRGDKP